MEKLEGAYAIWSCQMVLDIIRNLTFNGLLDGPGFIENIDDAMVNLVSKHPEHAQLLSGLADLSREAVQDALASRNRQT
jgi:hypothetical protein